MWGYQEDTPESGEKNGWQSTISDKPVIFSRYLVFLEKRQADLGTGREGSFPALPGTLYPCTGTVVYGVTLVLLRGASICCSIRWQWGQWTMARSRRCWRSGTWRTAWGPKSRWETCRPPSVSVFLIVRPCRAMRRKPILLSRRVWEGAFEAPWELLEYIYTLIAIM